MSEKTEKIKNMLDRMDGLTLAPPDESDKIRNTDSRRKKLLQFVHCLHILRLDGSVAVNDDYEIMAVEELKKKIGRITDREVQRCETIRLAVVNDHTHSWYIARHYYEKCSKLLCQMMVTVMDFMLELQTGSSALYTDGEKKTGVSIESELEALTKNFRESYYYMCAYDYCTERLAEYAGVSEYDILMPEHRRLVANGLPARLMKIAEAYGSLKGAAKIRIDDAVRSPEILYDEKILEKVYKDETAKYKDIDYAMNNYRNMVSAVDYAYAEQMRGKRGK